MARGKTGQLIVKLTETGQDSLFVRERAELTRQAAEINPAVIGPLALGSDLVATIDRWHAVCYPYIEGTTPDTDDRDTVETMAATLAVLHGSLASLTSATLPPVSALRETADYSVGRGQLIHGDYAAANLIATPTGLKIIDFDECGQGSVEFEIGNTLYMVLFDSWHSGRLDRYESFRSWFVDAYHQAASPRSDYHNPALDNPALDEAALDEAIRVRAKALKRWLAAPNDAPVGIRTSSPEWQQQLQRFVAETLP